MEYNAVKRVESTYGQLPDQLPPGSFLHSLGDSKELLVGRMCFNQDAGQISTDKTCSVNGQNMSLGQYLTENGLIGEDELSDCMHLNDGFYNTLAGLYADCTYLAVSSYTDRDHHVFNGFYSHAVMQQKTRSTYRIHGPKVSYGEERKVWMDALYQGEDSLYGGPGNAVYKMKWMDLYPEEQHDEIRQQRKGEYEFIKRKEEENNSRAQELTDLVKQQYKDVNENLIKTFIIFHPDMTTETKVDKIKEKDTADFIALVKDFAEE